MLRIGFCHRLVVVLLGVLMLGGTGCASTRTAQGKSGNTTTQSAIQLASSQATPSGTYLPGCNGTASVPLSSTQVNVDQFRQTVATHLNANLALLLDGHYQWNVYVYDPQHVLQAQGVQGVADTVHHCVWEYAIQGTGQTTVIAIGQLRCAPGKWCPRYTIARELDISST